MPSSFSVLMSTTGPIVAVGIRRRAVGEAGVLRLHDDDGVVRDGGLEGAPEFEQRCRADDGNGIADRAAKALAIALRRCGRGQHVRACRPRRGGRRGGRWHRPSSGWSMVRGASSSKAMAYPLCVPKPYRRGTPGRAIVARTGGLDDDQHRRLDRAGHAEIVARERDGAVDLLGQRAARSSTRTAAGGIEALGKAHAVVGNLDHD